MSIDIDVLIAAQKMNLDQLAYVNLNRQTQRASRSLEFAKATGSPITFQMAISSQSKPVALTNWLVNENV